MLEQRVARLESDVAEIRQDVREINGRLNKLDERMGRMEVGIEKIQARMDGLPTIWTFVSTLIGTMFSTVALVLVILRMLLPS